MWQHLTYIGIGFLTALVIGVVPPLLSYSLDSLLWWMSKKNGYTPAFKRDFGGYWLVGILLGLGGGAIYGIGRFVYWCIHR